MTGIYQKIHRVLTQQFRKVLLIPDELASAKVLTSQVIANQIAQKGILQDIRDAEFKVFSQFGEDGILQYLINQTGIPVALRSFVEFGVESYEEANTRLLLLRGWHGLIIDGSDKNITKVKESALYWRYGLTAISAFIDADNINRLISDGGYRGDIGILSVDIDGNDFWVWERLNVVRPVIVVAEYNSVFGAHHAISVPYDPAFTRTKAHYSNLYWGCSIKALEVLGKKKGYTLVGSNSAGNNAFFVRNDCLNKLRGVTAEEAHVDSRFRESRDIDGRLTYLTGSARLQKIAEMKVVDVTTGETLLIGSLISGSGAA